MFIYESPQRSKISRSMPRKLPNRRVDQTIEHISKGWIPVNPAVLKQVQERISDGEYRGNPAQLVLDLKEDPGLFFHAARNLKSMVEDVEAGIDPFNALQRLEEEKISKIFSVTEKQISEHRLRDMRNTQALRMQHSVISSRAAEALAARVNIEPGIAFSTAIFRQLGHQLIAWNYPDIYARALSAQRSKGTEAGVELKKFLGVSPLQIGSKFATEWNMSPEIRSAVAPQREEASRPFSNQPRSQAEKEEEGGLTLEKLCEVSELFAQANDPEHYPGASDKWKETEQRFSDIITPDFFKEIEKPVHAMVALCEGLASKAPTPSYFLKKPDDQGLSQRAKALYLGNTYIRRCQPQVREKLLQVYEAIKEESENSVAVNALCMLVDEAVPMAGFARGCLYIVDQKSLNLKPSLRMGELALSHYRVVRLHENNPVAQALATQVPFKQEGEGVTGETAVHICGALGHASRPGVLYLELKDKDADEQYNALACFQAVRQTLIDCLGNGKIG